MRLPCLTSVGPVPAEHTQKRYSTCANRWLLTYISPKPIAAITFELITTRMDCLQVSNVVTAALRGRNYMIYMHAARFERKISRTEQADTSLLCSELLPKLAKLMAVCHCLSTRITRRAVLKASLHGSQGVHLCDSGCRTLLLYRMVSTLSTYRNSVWQCSLEQVLVFWYGAGAPAHYPVPQSSFLLA